MELRSSSQQGRQQEEQSERWVTEASVNKVEALARQLETLIAFRDAKCRRRRELEEQINRQPQHAQPVATPRQVWEPAPRIPVPQMDKFDGSTPVSEWWTTFMAYIALRSINEAIAIKLLPFYLMGIALQFFTHLDGLSKTSLNSIRDAFFSRFRPTVPISHALMLVKQGADESVDKYINRVRKLAADSSMEEDSITYFAREGLRQKLRLIVVPQKPKSLEDLRKMAALAEEATGKDTDTPPTYLTYKTALAERIKVALASVDAAVENKVRNYLEDQRAGVTGVFVGKIQQRRPKPVSRDWDNFRQTNRSREPGSCFRCGEKLQDLPGTLRHRSKCKNITRLKEQLFALKEKIQDSQRTRRPRSERKNITRLKEQLFVPKGCMSRFYSQLMFKPENQVEKEEKGIEDIWSPSSLRSPWSFTGLPHESRRYEDISGKIRGQTKSQKQPAGLHIPSETEKPSTTFSGKCEPKPVFRKFTEAASKLSTHSLYFKTKHFPRFQYVYNLVKDFKSRVEQCRVRRVGIDEMYKNVNIKIVIVGNFRDKDLHLLTKSTENKMMPKDKHIWKVEPLVCFDNEFFSESNVKKCDLELESTCHKILIQSDTFCDKRDKADDSIIIVERNKEQIKETITSCLEKPLFLLLHELLKDLKTEGSSRLASGLIAEIEAIQKQMKSCHIKDKDVSSIVLPSASASSIVPDNIIDFLFREPDVHSFGIWRNSSFKVFVKRTDEDKLRDELIKLNPNFFEMFNLEIEKRKLEDKQTDTMQGDVILAEIQDEGGGYRQGTLGGFVISTDKERKLYALTCNHLFPEEGKQAFTENLDEIGTCSFTTRENTCDFAAIEIKKEFSKNCDETFHKEDSGKTNAYVFSENLKDIGIVHKIGATTKGTKGTIISSEYYDKLKDNTSREHVFLVQGTQGNFSKEGDSGSLVFTRSKNARQTSVDVLGMVIGNKVTVLDDDEEQENQVENKPGVTKGSEKIGNDSKNEKVDAKESSNTSSFQEGTFAASSSDVPDNISCCFRIDTALQLFKEKQGEEVKFKDDLSPSTSLSSDSDDTNRDTS